MIKIILYNQALHLVVPVGVLLCIERITSSAGPTSVSKLAGAFNPLSVYISTDSYQEHVLKLDDPGPRDFARPSLPVGRSLLQDISEFRQFLRWLRARSSLFTNVRREKRLHSCSASRVYKMETMWSTCATRICKVRHLLIPDFRDAFSFRRSFARIAHPTKRGRHSTHAGTIKPFIEIESLPIGFRPSSMSDEVSERGVS